MVVSRLAGLGSGAISGIDWEAIIQQLIYFERQPVRNWRVRQSNYEYEINAWRDVNMRLKNLQSRANDLMSASIWKTKRSTSSNTDIVVATSGTDATEGKYDVRVRQLATQSISKSTNELNTKKGAKSTHEVRAGSPVVNLDSDFSTTNFDNAIDGSIKVNGYTYNIADYSSVRQLMDDINDYSKTSLSKVAAPGKKIDIEKPWESAGFENVPVGTVTINDVVFDLSDYSTVKEFMDEINDFSKVSSAQTGSGNTNDPIDRFFGTSVDGTITINNTTFTISNYKTVDSLITAVNNSYFADATLSYDNEKMLFTIRRDTPGTDLNLSQTGENPFFTAAKISVLDADVTITYDSAIDKFTISRNTPGQDLNLSQSGTPGQGENLFFNEVKINTFHSGATIRYDPTTDKFSIEHDDPGATLKLWQSGTNPFFKEINIFKEIDTEREYTTNVTGVNPSLALYLAGFDNPVGVKDEGVFKINNVEITWDADQDTLNGIIGRINASGAQVTAFFDESMDKISLTSKDYGSNPIMVSDVSGTFALTTLKLPEKTPSEDLGTDAAFTINSTNSDDEITKGSNTFTMNGITFTLKNVSKDPWTNYSDANPTTIQVTLDISQAKDAIEQFVTQYNSTQSFIEKKIAYDPDTKKAEDLNADITAMSINSRIRRLTTDRYNKRATITSQFPVTLSGETSIDVSKPFDQAGFDQTPTGKVVINRVEFDLAIYTGGSKTVQDFMNDVKSKANVSITYDSTSDRFTIRNEDYGEDLVLIEKDYTNVGFFTEVNITPGTYETLKNDMNKLADIGITTGKYKSDQKNQLVIDSAKLEAALRDRPEDVRKLFAIDMDKRGDEDYGLAYELYEYLSSLTKSTGVVGNKINALQGLVTDIDKDMKDFEARLVMKEEYLRSQFILMEEAIGKMQALSTSISGYLTSLLTPNISLRWK
ncbi:MAG: flagellar filament capping protein FliD [bacterium]|nr:flagellar filament capping protein FliD [bacterium]